MTSLHFISLGCPKNLVDSEVMLGTLAAAGFTLTDDPASAEAIVVNTCAFIEDAKREAIDTILEMAKLKQEGKCRLLVAAGCLPQRYKDEIAKLFPEVDIFVGAGDFPKIVSIIAGWAGGQAVHVGTPRYLYDGELPRMHATARHMAYLKIAEGCFHPCSFCAIPRIRGPFRSRGMASLVEEARGMIQSGVREINVIAQDTTAYGCDIGADIATLLEQLAGLRGQKWIRLLYAYPHRFPMRLIRAMRDCPDICQYLDIPIQHISDRILKSMQRGSSSEVRGLISRIRREIPSVSLRTTLIVGYPGETEAEFKELLEFVREARFEHLGAFTFSTEEGTRASRLKRRVPAEVAAERRARLMELQRKISLENNRRLIGRRLNVLIEGPSADGQASHPRLAGAAKSDSRAGQGCLKARHEGQAPDVDGVVYIAEGKAEAGEFAEVLITEAREYDLVGRVV